MSPVISKSVFRYCKVLFYPPNIDTVLFYGQYTNIDTDPQYPKICIKILVLPLQLFQTETISPHCAQEASTEDPFWLVTNSSRTYSSASTTTFLRHQVHCKYI